MPLSLLVHIDIWESGTGELLLRILNRSSTSATWHRTASAQAVGKERTLSVTCIRTAEDLTVKIPNDQCTNVPNLGCRSRSTKLKPHSLWEIFPMKTHERLQTGKRLSLASESSKCCGCAAGIISRRRLAQVCLRFDSVGCLFSIWNADFTWSNPGGRTAVLLRQAMAWTPQRRRRRGRCSRSRLYALFSFFFHPSL